jgi:hypothetical protein
MNVVLRQLRVFSGVYRASSITRASDHAIGGKPASSWKSSSV